VNQETFPRAEAIAHLQQTDPVLGHIIARCGPCTLQPHDLGIRKAMQRAYGYRRLPAPVTMHRHARKWVPYRTIASWYLWRSLDGAVTPFQETPNAE
jgi:hypothetical protein